MILKTKYFLPLITILFACDHESSRTKTSFDIIDVSFNRGRNGITSVYVDSTKNIKVLITKYDGQKIFYQDTLNDSSIVNLNILSNKLLSAKTDSIIGQSSCFTFPYYFEITSKNQKLQTLVNEDINYSQPQFKAFIENILRLTTTIEHNSLDSTFVFKSLSKVIGLPGPPIDTIKFIPPIIKNE